MILKQQYSKTYDGEEHIIRFHRWKKIKSIIDRQNQNFAKGRQQYFLSENRFADQVRFSFIDDIEKIATINVFLVSLRMEK